MKKSIALFTALVMILCLFGACGGGEASQQGDAGAENAGGAVADGEVITLRFANVTQPDHPMNMGCEFFIQLLEERSEGRFQVTNYPARQLGDDRELFEQVQQGSLDMALVSVGPVGSTSDLAAAFQIPFMFTSWEQWLTVMNDAVTQDLFDGFMDNNVRAVALYDSGFRNAVTVDGTVTELGDFSGLKFRVAETPMHIAIFEALGASPTPIAYGEIYSSLQNKVIDGLEMDFAALLGEKHYEVAKNVTLTKHFTWPGVHMINLDLWNSLSEADRQLIMECARDAMAMNVEYVQAQENAAIAELQELGVTIVELSDAQRQAMIDATRAVAKDYMNKDERIRAFAEYAMSLA